MDTINNILCPNCGFEINIEQVLAEQTERKIKQEYEEKMRQQNQELVEFKKNLEKEKTEFEAKKQRENEIFAEKLNKKLDNERLKNQEELKLQLELKEKEIQQKYIATIKYLEEQNNKSQKEKEELSKKELELLKKEGEISLRLNQLELDYQKKLNSETEKVSEMIKKQFEEAFQHQLQVMEKERLEEKAKFELELSEKNHQLEQQKKLAEEMQQKANQRSMQLQGEVQELKLEEMLKKRFMMDIIQEVPKGISGADVIQIVRDDNWNEIGKLIYESKRTKSFSEEWITKLKDDQLKVQADIPILVTQAFPKDMDGFGERNGVWICHYDEVLQVAAILREALHQVAKVRIANTDSGNKMKMLYDYLTSSEFHQRIKNIIDAFNSMKNELEQEQRAFQKIWKQREVQMERVITNTIDLYSTFSAIAGSGVLQIDDLELPYLNAAEQ